MAQPIEYLQVIVEAIIFGLFKYKLEMTLENCDFILLQIYFLTPL